VELSAGEKLRSISARGTVDCRLKFPESFWFPRVYGKIVGDLQSRFANKGATVFESLASQERIDLAKTTMTKVRDHFLYLIELHANNLYAVYSPTLSSQIPKSYAANAFFAFQRSMYQLEIVRLCALWESAEPKKENIATVVELIDNESIIRIPAANAAVPGTTSDPGHTAVVNPRSDPQHDAKIVDPARESDKQFGIQVSKQADWELRDAITAARKILQSERPRSLMNARDKHIASLNEARRERCGPIAPIRIGDETDLIERSIPIVERLYRWINGISFSIRESQRIDQDNAEALWKGCTFNVLR
jgi:hypothetical protein